MSNKHFSFWKSTIYFFKIIYSVTDPGNMPNQQRGPDFVLMSLSGVEFTLVVHLDLTNRPVKSSCMEISQ